MKSYVPFSRTKGYEAIELDASTSQSKPGIHRFADATQIETQPRSSVSFGISGTDLSNLNEVRFSELQNYGCQLPKPCTSLADLVFCMCLDRIRTKLA